MTSGLETWAILAQDFEVVPQSWCRWCSDDLEVAYSTLVASADCLLGRTRGRVHPARAEGRAMCREWQCRRLEGMPGLVETAGTSPTRLCMRMLGWRRLTRIEVERRLHCRRVGLVKTWRRDVSPWRVNVSCHGVSHGTQRTPLSPPVTATSCMRRVHSGRFGINTMHTHLRPSSTAAAATATRQESWRYSHLAGIDPLHPLAMPISSSQLMSGEVATACLVVLQRLGLAVVAAVALPLQVV